MHERADTLLRWSPRILGVLMCLFLGLFALDAFGEGRTVGQAILDFLIHLIPSAALLAVVAAAWRREWIGGVLFVALALGYAYWAREHLTWIAAIAAPLLIVGSLYFVSWSRRGRIA